MLKHSKSINIDENYDSDSDEEIQHDQRSLQEKISEISTYL